MAYPLSSDAALTPLMTYQDAADVLGVSLATLKRLVRDGDLPVVRFRGCARLRPDDLARFIDEWTSVRRTTL
jgi:excisionase family DNA binding protein